MATPTETGETKNLRRIVTLQRIYGQLDNLWREVEFDPSNQGYNTRLQIGRAQDAIQIAIKWLEQH